MSNSKIRGFTVFRSEFALLAYIDDFEIPQVLMSQKATYKDIRAYVKEMFGINVTNLNVAQTKERLGLVKYEYKGREASGKYPTPILKPEKEKAITEALRAFGILSEPQQ